MINELQYVFQEKVAFLLNYLLPNHKNIEQQAKSCLHYSRL